MTNDPGSPSVKRRDFLKILGAGTATTAALGACTSDIEKLVPYTVSPDQTVPGVSTYFATTCRECAAGCGVLAETRDGRVIKLEGNPQHPVNRGALCARGQAAVQGLYNPDRYKSPMIRQGDALVATTWENALRVLQQRLGQARGGGQAGGAAFLNRHEGGSFPAFLDGWLAAMGMGPHYSVEMDGNAAVAAANMQTYGVAFPRLAFDAVRLVVSLGADFLDGWGASVPQQLDWADARSNFERAPRLIYVGARRSLTGLNADEWVNARPGSELALLNFLRGSGSVQQAEQASGVSAATLQRIQQEVAAAAGSVMYLAGATGADAFDVALAAASMNSAGGAVRAGEGYTMGGAASSYADLRALVARMNAGQVPLLMVRGANPAYELKNAGFAQAMAKVPFKVSFSSYPDETSELCDLVLPDHHPLESWGDAEPIRGTLSLQQPAMDPVFNTRATGDVLIGLARTMAVSGGVTTAASYRDFIISRFPGGSAGLASALPRGSAPGTTLARTQAPAAATDRATIQGGVGGTQGDFFLLVYPSPTLGSGEGANKPWLQELPDPVTKISWQSVVEMHPRTAMRLGIDEGDHVEVSTAAGRVTAPVYPYLGIREDTVAIALGRGHTAYGRFAKDVGVNALDALPVVEDARTGARALAVTRASVRKTGDHSQLVTTEGSARQHGRGIAQALLVGDLGKLREATGGEHAEEISTQGTEGAGRGTQPRGAAPAAGAHGEEGAESGEHEFPGDASHDFLPGLRAPTAADAQGDLGAGVSSDRRNEAGKDLGMYDPQHWSGMAKRRWAMAIDLARCTGCSACITACWNENNIPTVGAPTQGRALSPFGHWDTRPGANIIKGREMTWIRLERYYEGGEDGSANFETRFVPMLCQHCGNAPCEPVCPVYATYHAPDGLNVQVYNRCVGTRYCANNCPYKVRYYNWFGYGEVDRRQYAWPEPMNWALNPDVTVRGKGIMEKCSFCVQRIREAENRAKLENRELAPDEFTVACAQACPSRAITFGDASDGRWTVAELARDRRAYHVFEELNTYTAVVYLKKVNHPGPASPAGA
ncbi:MAG: 4Fe-4S dicluster domain-containing protein [Gemmatimonadaceae bacterium]